MGNAIKRWWQGPPRQTAEEAEGRERQGIIINEGHGDAGGEVERRERQGVQEGQGAGEVEVEEREQQGVHEGHGGQVEGREGQDVQEGRGNGGGGGEVEGVAGGINSLPQQPAGHRTYTLSPGDVSLPIESQVQFTESYLDSTKQHFHDIDQTYKAALDKRTEIGNLLNRFKEKLKLKNTADFPTCFQQLRDRVGKYEQLELCRDEQLRIILGGEVDANSTREAVDIFNDMLQKCREFPAEAEAATASITEKIQAVESEHLKIEKTVKALDQSKAFLEQIRAFGEEIDKLVGDVKWARGYLVSRRMATGDFH